MHKIILLLSALLSIMNSLAQNSHLDYRLGVKLNNVSSYEEHRTFQGDTGGVTYRYATDRWQILHPSVSFQMKDSNNNFHEFELLNLTLNNVRSTGETIIDSTRATSALLYDEQTSVTNISARYEYILTLAKRKNSRMVPSLGFALNPQYRLEKQKPLISSSFPSSEQSIALRTQIIPRLTYHLSNRVLLDLNLPLCLTSFSHNTYKRNDPSLPARQQKIANTNFEAFPPLYSLRIGIGIKL